MRDYNFAFHDRRSFKERWVVAQVQKPKNAASTVVGGLQILVHAISDDEAERARLAELQGRRQTLQRALSELI